MLLEIAVGDAYGCCFEWTERWIVSTKNKLEYLSLQENPSLIKPGNYTDDTQMTLAIAELMISGKEWTPESLAEKFVEVFHRDPRRGYAPGFWVFLTETKTGADFLKNIHPTSSRSGAAMRAGPLGLISDINSLKQLSDIQASVTHNTVDGRASALCAALAVHYFRFERGPKKDLGEFLYKHCAGFNLRKIEGLEHIPVEGWPCVIAAMQAILNNDTLSGVLKSSINFAGDTDTIAAIAMAAASQSVEIEQDLPQNLVDGLENNEYGRDYIISLDDQLEEIFS